MYSRPEPRIVVVDDRLPCRGHNKLIFAGAPRDNFWVAIVEKATKAQPPLFRTSVVTTRSGI